MFLGLILSNVLRRFLGEFLAQQEDIGCFIVLQADSKDDES